MFWYILPEFIILVAVWTQQFYEILLGVHENREIDLENITGQDVLTRPLDGLPIQGAIKVTEPSSAESRFVLHGAEPMSHGMDARGLGQRLGWNSLACDAIEEGLEPTLCAAIAL